VHASRADRQCYVEAVVDREPCSAGGEDVVQRSRLRVRGAGRGRLVAQLDPVDAALGGSRDRGQQVAERSAGLRDEVELIAGCFGRRQERFPPLV
jgi:hypothetical protein